MLTEILAAVCVAVLAVCFLTLREVRTLRAELQATRVSIGGDFNLMLQAFNSIELNSDLPLTLGPDLTNGKPAPTHVLLREAVEAQLAICKT